MLDSHCKYEINLAANRNKRQAAHARNTRFSFRLWFSMTLTASDVSSLTRSLSRWEYTEYGACAFVAIACAGEYIADFTNWLTAGDECRKKRLAKRSTLLLIVSLAVELFCLVQTNSISGQLVGSLSDKATNADTKAQSALDKSGTAETKAGDANISAKGAADEAARAKDEAEAVAKLSENLARYIGVVAKGVNPRIIDRNRFIQLMKGQPKAVIEIWYEPNDGESELFALQISIALGKEGLGWDAETMPFTAVRDPGMEIIRQDTGSNGLAYAAKIVSSDLNSPLQVLYNAVGLSLGGWGKDVAMFVTDPTLPENTFVIAVGHHIVNVPLWLPPTPKKQKQSSKPTS
jgi:hypothetical protein